MDFTNISQNYLLAIADKRNRIPRKSLYGIFRDFLTVKKNFPYFNTLFIFVVAILFKKSKIAFVIIQQVVVLRPENS